MSDVSEADRKFYRQISDLHDYSYSDRGPLDRQLGKIQRARGLIDTISNPEEANALSFYPKVWALDNIIKVWPSYELCFEAASMMVTLSQSEECAADTDNRTASWATQKLRLLAQAAEGASKYETSIIKNIEQFSSDPRYKAAYAEECAAYQMTADKMADFQHEIFKTALILFADKTQTGERFGSLDETILLRNVLNGMSESDTKEQARAELKETLVNVAIDRPELVKKFLKEEFEHWEMYREYIASPADRLAAKQGLESFSVLAKAGRWIDSLTRGLMQADRHPDSIASLAELRKDRRSPISIITA